MPASPWKSVQAAAPGREYLALLTFLPLRRHAAIPAFLGHSRRVQKQLAGAAGLIGYSLLARPLRKEFWTLSVWEGEAALQAFVMGGAHLETMQRLPPEMGETRFVRWRLPGAEVPPRWPDALRRVARGTPETAA